MVIVKSVELKDVPFAVVVAEHNFIVGNGTVLSPTALAAQQSKRGSLLNVRKLFYERRRTDEIAARGVLSEVALRVPRMVAHHAKRRLNHQLYKTPKRRSDAVPESSSDG